MNKLEDIVGMIMDKYEEENGEVLKLEEGIEIASIFNDGVVIVGMEDSRFNIKVLAGKPYQFDYNLDLT